MSDVYHTHIQDHGRVVIPAPLRKSLGLQPGDPVVIEQDEDGFRVRTLSQTLRAAQAAVAAYIPTGVSLADELIAERQVEADSE
jgi:AbrB family looped-hinge helix DNA binding protein